ncbi:MAG TPA: NAD(P)H-binding protein [bacterium]
MSGRVTAVVGATGKIGRVLTEALLARRHEVRAIGRSGPKLSALARQGAKVFEADFDDAEALARAFRGADAVFSFLPPGYGEDDLGAFQDRVGSAIVLALREAKAGRVLNLSSLGAGFSEGTGPIAGLHRQEQRLASLEESTVRHLRPGYFMENQLWSIPLIKSRGINGSPIRGDIPIDMVATRDIGEAAAELLHEFDRIEEPVVELAGPAPVTLAQMTSELGAAIGKPELPYVPLPFEAAGEAMRGEGMPPRTVALMLEMYRAFNEGRITATRPLRRGATAVRTFAAEFAAAYRAG